jgi:hypothetical protein
MSVHPIRTMSAPAAGTRVHPRDKRAARGATPVFVQARRALILMQTARATGHMIHDLRFHCEPRRRHEPLSARLDTLSVRYDALGGDPSDLRR